MSEEVKPNAKEASTQDAQLVAENIISGEEKAPTVDAEADYQAAQKFSVPNVDRTGEGVKAAEATTAPEISAPEKTTVEAKSTGNPDDYREMAKEIGGSKDDAVSSVSDQLVDKALENKLNKQSALCGIQNSTLGTPEINDFVEGLVTLKGVQGVGIP